MIEYEDRCCSCAVPGYPCIGNACSLRHYRVFVCDECGEEVDKLWWVDGQQLCECCVFGALQEVE